MWGREGCRETGLGKGWAGGLAERDFLVMRREERSVARSSADHKTFSLFSRLVSGGSRRRRRDCFFDFFSPGTFFRRFLRPEKQTF